MNPDSDPEAVSKKKICPYCKTGALYERVPRAWWAKMFLFFLPLKRYKCYCCLKKPYIMERQTKIE